MDEAAFSPVRRERTAGHIALAVGKYVLVWGGYQDELGEKYVSTSCIWLWDTQFGIWNLLQTYGHRPMGLSGAVGIQSLIEVNGTVQRMLYVIGGHGHSGHVSTMYRLNISTATKLIAKNHDLEWTTLTVHDESRTFSPRDKFTGWEHGGNLFIFGGYGQDTQNYIHDTGSYVQDLSQEFGRGWNNQLLEYNVKTSSWSSPDVKGDVPLPRAAHGVAKLGDHIFMFGGRHQWDRLNDLHVLDMVSVTWTQLRPSGDLPVGRSWHSFTKITDHQIFLFGGYSDRTPSQRPLNDAWILDVTVARWTQMPVDEAKFTCRLWHTATQTGNGQVTMIGGCVGDILDDTVEPRHTNSVVTYRVIPKSLFRLSMEAAFRYRRVLHRYYSILPRVLCDELCQRQTIANFRRSSSAPPVFGQ